MSTRILRLKDVKAMTGLSRSTIYAEIAKGNFPGLGESTPADQCDIGNRMMGTSERPFGHQSSMVIDLSGNRMDLCRFKSLFKGERRHYCR